MEGKTCEERFSMYILQGEGAFTVTFVCYKLGAKDFEKSLYCHGFFEALGWAIGAQKALYNHHNIKVPIAINVAPQSFTPAERQFKLGMEESGKFCPAEPWGIKIFKERNEKEWTLKLYHIIDEREKDFYEKKFSLFEEAVYYAAGFQNGEGLTLSSFIGVTFFYTKTMVAGRPEFAEKFSKGIFWGEGGDGDVYHFIEDDGLSLAPKKSKNQKNPFLN
ncbi:MAG: hypothetical protein PHD51_03560 [Patescibacteria group bacterium]|nr:hypothetical protein [Patescibacteria group bacterium]MDD5490949.1 hypothetical protein [Patescibacteria group bacterium]